MNIQSNRMRGQRGSAIVVVMTVLLTIWLAVESMQFSSSSRGVTAQRVNAQVRAQLMAEAGANYAYSVLATNFSRRNTPGAFVPTLHGVGSWTGTYTMAVTPVGDDMATICSTGFVSIGVQKNASDPSIAVSALSRVLIDIKNYGPDWGGGDEELFGFGQVSGGNASGGGNVDNVNEADVYSGGDLSFNGSGSLTTPNLIVNGNLSIVGTYDIIGDVTAESVDPSALDNISGTVTISNVVDMTLPVIDFTPYYAEALANGDVWNGNQTWSSMPAGASAGDVLWVNGDVRISGNFDMLNISIFATGDINISNSGDFSKAHEYPLFASRDGTINMSAGGSYDGLIYTLTGDIEKSGGGSLVGLMMSADEIVMNGGWDSYTYVMYLPVAPGSGGNDDVIGVSAWQE